MIQWLKIETRYQSIKDLIPCASCGVQSILARSLRDISGGPLCVCIPGMQIPLSSAQRVAFSGKHGYRVRLVYFGWYYMYSAMKICLMTAYRVLSITPTTLYLSLGNRFFQTFRNVSFWEADWAVLTLQPTLITNNDGYLWATALCRVVLGQNDWVRNRSIVKGWDFCSTALGLIPNSDLVVVCNSS